MQPWLGPGQLWLFWIFLNDISQFPFFVLLTRICHLLRSWTNTIFVLMFCTAITQITQTPMQPGWNSFVNNRKVEKDEWSCLLASSKRKKNHKIPNSNGWHACKSWLQLPCFILFDCAVCYAKFYQASTWTGPTWACLSSQTWRGASLLHVGFLSLVLGLDVFRMWNFCPEIFRSFTYGANI